MIDISLVRRCTLSGLVSLGLLGSLIAQSRIREHSVQKDETVYGIARRYDVSVDRVYELNPWAKKQIKEGDKLLIPSPHTSSNTSSTSSTAASSPSNLGKHRIEAGETLYRISRKYGVTEEAILKANPGLSATNFQAGAEITIPGPTASPAPTSKTVTRPIPVVEDTKTEIHPVKVLLMLPLQKNSPNLEFYEGFLMGVLDLKKNGVSIDLQVLDTPTNASVSEAIAQGKLRGQDLVIGGVNDNQVQQISQARGYSYQIVPFSRYLSTETVGDRTIQLNPRTSDVATRVVPAFLRKYAGKDICFVNRTGDSEDTFSRLLKDALSGEGIRYRTLNLSTTHVGILGANTVLVPISADKTLAENLFAQLDKDDPCTLFGYPQWQSYGAQFASAMSQYNTTIYSTFFFDPKQTESYAFLSKYRAWYNKKISNAYPKYSVLGYDIARYFIRAYSAYQTSFVSNGDLLPSDGLQIDINLGKNKEMGGYLNQSFYFITFTSNGNISRQTYK